MPVVELGVGRDGPDELVGGAGQHVDDLPVGQEGELRPGHVEIVPPARVSFEQVSALNDK